MKFSEKLEKLDACNEAINWVKDGHEKTAWEDCEKSERLD
jgi:hypothetical protein